MRSKLCALIYEAWVMGFGGYAFPLSSSCVPFDVTPPFVCTLHLQSKNISMACHCWSHLREFVTFENHSFDASNDLQGNYPASKVFDCIVRW